MHGPLSGKERTSFFFLVAFTVNGLIFLLKYGHADLIRLISYNFCY